MKTRVALITIFDVANFGTYLQALATALSLKRLGAKVKIIHYERPFKNTKQLRRNFILRNMYYLYFWLRGYNGSLFTLRCRRFVSKYVRITKTYFSIEELKKDPPKADVYITGSDQVWNTEHNRGIDEVFYLAFAPSVKKKAAFAASIGQDAIPNEYKERTRELLSQYDCISVRENKAVELLAEIGISAKQMLDPTLMLNREQWLKYASKRIVAEDYLLVYSVEPAEYDLIVSDVATKIAEVKKLKIVSVSNFGEDKRIPGCDEYFDFALPQVFLSLMAHASYVVASSFHGTAFAINFNRQFLTINPGAFSSRINSLLKLTGLENRRLSGMYDLSEDLLDQEIDFIPINNILVKNRNNCFDYISKCIVK